MPPSQSKRILVVGGGFSGIGSIKCLKEEGFEPVCYEKTDHYGGTWHYQEQTPVGIPSCMYSTVINHSKEMGAITNYVPDKSYPNYMRHDQLLKMFREMGEKFDCFKHVVYNREVVRLVRSPDYDTTGRWIATVKNSQTGETVQETFDAALVGVGQFSYPKMVQYPGMEKYKGTVLHTHSLKKVDGFRDKKVLVIGVGCSGVDAAVELSSVASKVYLSSRNGVWIMPRVGPYGLPFDYAMLRRFVDFIQSIFGVNFASWWMESSQLNQKFNHNLYNLRPAYHALSKDPVTNDLIAAKIISGSVLVRKDVKWFTENGVIFENETHETELDAVIMATGYKWEFPFLEEGTIVQDDEGRIQLYKCVFPIHLKHPTLAIIGSILPFGPGFPLGEMQCRWATQLLACNLSLPSREVMTEDVRRRHAENVRRYAPSDKMTLRVDYIPYMDELAEVIGARPNMWKLFLTDITMWRALAFGPSLPYQYRLEGPHKWEGAREAILTAHERVRYPFSGEYKKSTGRRKVNLMNYLKYVVCLILLSLWFTQSDMSVKCYLAVIFFPYFISWKGFYKKWFFLLLALPFFINQPGFVSSYMITLFAPVFLALITSV